MLTRDQHRCGCDRCADQPPRPEGGAQFGIRSPRTDPAHTDTQQEQQALAVHMRGGAKWEWSTSPATVRVADGADPDHEPELQPLVPPLDASPIPEPGPAAAVAFDGAASAGLHSLAIIAASAQSASAAAGARGFTSAQPRAHCQPRSRRGAHVCMFAHPARLCSRHESPQLTTSTFCSLFESAICLTGS